jgi:hypothetical protein
MKFYNDKENFDLWHKIKFDNLTAILNTINTMNYNTKCVYFFKNGKWSNNKNAAYIDGIYKQFRLNDNLYGNQKRFTKESWRRFIKMQVFL